MLAAAASLLNVKVLVLDVGDSAPAKQVISPEKPLEHVDGSFAIPENIKKLAAQADVLTVEIEHVNADVLEEISKSSRVEVNPSPFTIRTIQNKYIQKRHLRDHRIPVADFVEVAPTPEALTDTIKSFGLPLMLKSQTLAYDGRGNYAMNSEDDVAEALKALSGRPLYAERWAPFVKELAVMVVRSANGEVLSYPTVETVHKNNICHLVFGPIRGSNSSLDAKARKVAEDAITTFPGAGVFGVEMFLMPDGMGSRLEVIHTCLCPLLRGDPRERDCPKTS